MHNLRSINHQAFSKISAQDFFLLAIILLLAILTRFYHIGYDSFWVDEGFTAVTATLPFEQMWNRTIHDTHQPLHGILLHFWAQLMGRDEIALRSFSAVFNILTLLLLFPLGKLLFNRKIAYLTMLIFLVSPIQVHFAQEARSYSLMLFLSTLSIFTFLKSIRDKQRSYIAVHILSTGLLVLTHVYGWLILAFENLWYFFSLKDKKNFQQYRQLLLMNLGVLLIFLPYLSRFLEIISSVQDAFWIKRPTLLHLAGVFLQFSGSRLALVLSALLIFSGVIYIFVNKTRPVVESSSVLFNWLWLMSVVLLPFLISQFLRPILVPRYALSATVPFYFLIAYGIYHFPGKGGKLIALMIFLLFSASTLYHRSQEATREPWRDAVSELQRLAAPEDLIVLSADKLAPHAPQHHLNTIGPPFTPFDVFIYYADSLPQPVMGITKEILDDSLQYKKWEATLLAHGKNVWWLDSHFWGSNSQLMERLQRNFILLRTFSFYHRDLYGREVCYIKLYHLIPRGHQIPG